MAEVRKTAQSPAKTEQDESKEWDGTGNRRLAVHEGDADRELVENGMTQVPLEYRGK